MYSSQINDQNKDLNKIFKGYEQITQDDKKANPFHHFSSEMKKHGALIGRFSGFTKQALWSFGQVTEIFLKNYEMDSQFHHPLA